MNFVTGSTKCTAIAILLFAFLFVACDDESSSSGPAPDPIEESCSSIKQTSSEAKQSSSSVENEESSSSEEEPSSSSKAKSRSKKGEKTTSSSSVAESSSSSYDKTKAFNGTLWSAGGYKKFTDPHDNRTYYYIQINGIDTGNKAASINVMAENLNVGTFIRSNQDQEDDSKVECYCYGNDDANCDKYGGLYQWAEMMQLPSRCNEEKCGDLIKPNHQGVCPDGWRLLTYNDYYIIVHANNNEDGVKGTRSAYGFGGTNASGYSLVGAGFLWNHEFTGLNEGTYWFYPQEVSEKGGDFVYASSQNSTSSGNPMEEVHKTNAFSVRCVMVE